MTQIITFSPKQTGEEWGVSERWNRSLWRLYLVTGVPKLCSWLWTHQGLQQSWIPVAESCSGRSFLVSVIQALWPNWEAPAQPPHRCVTELPRARLLQQGSAQPPLLHFRSIAVITPAERLEFSRDCNNIRTWGHKVLMSTLKGMYCSLCCYPDSVRLEQDKDPWQLHWMNDPSKGQHTIENSFFDFFESEHCFGDFQSAVMTNE